MISIWEDIVDAPLADDAKQAACLQILQNYINCLAVARFGQANAPLRFYADMIVLQQMLSPIFARDGLGRCAIQPGWLFVTDRLAMMSAIPRHMSVTGG